MPNAKKSALLGCVFSVLILSSLAAAFGGAEMPSVDELRQIWIDRTKGLQKVEIEWSTEETADHRALFGKSMRQKNASGDLIVNAPVKTEARCFFASDGERWRYTETGTRWDNVVERVVERTRDRAQSGQWYKSLNDRKIDADEVADSGSIHAPAKGDIYATAPFMSPYFLLLNPFHPRLGQLSPDRFDLDKEASVESLTTHECLVLKFTHRAEGIPIRVWLAHELDWLPVRCEIAKRVEMEYEYGADERTRPLPIRWRITIRSPDSTYVDNLTSATMTNWRLLDEANDANFDIKFSPGTVVWNFQKMTDGVPENFLILPDGSARPITALERAREANVTTLTNTKPQEFESPTVGKSWTLFLGVNLAVVCVIVVLYCCNRSMKGK